MKKVCGPWLLVLLFSATALAQAGATNGAPATREDVAKLFNLMHVQEQTKNVMESMLKQQRVIVRDALRKRHPEISEEELKRTDGFMDDLMREFPIAQMLDDLIPVYQKHLTKTDVEAMGAFYASPTGQKLLREMPAIMSESMQSMMPHLQEAMDKMMDRAGKMAEDEREKKAAPQTRKN